MSLGEVHVIIRHALQWRPHKCRYPNLPAVEIQSNILKHFGAHNWIGVINPY